MKHASEWALRRSEARAAAVVLEAGEHPRAPAEVDLDGDVADQPRAVLADGLEVDQADAGQPLTSEFVGVAEQLVAAADGEDHLSGGRRGVQRVALDGRQILGAQRLVAVLAAADVEEVVGVGVERVAEAGAGQLERRARATRSACAAAAGCRGRRRCSSGPGTARRRAGGQPRKITTCGGDVLGRLGDVAQLLGLQAVRGGLLGEAAGRDDRAARSGRRSSSRSPSRADALADPLDRDAARSSTRIAIGWEM